MGLKSGNLDHDLESESVHYFELHVCITQKTPLDFFDKWLVSMIL